MSTYTYVYFEYKKLFKLMQLFAKSRTKTIMNLTKTIIENEFWRGSLSQKLWLSLKVENLLPSILYVIYKNKVTQFLKIG